MDADRTQPEIGAAVFNNALWCDAVCRAYGCETEFADGLWMARAPSPPFYPNAITLTRGDGDAQMHRITLLADAGLPPGWSLKDGFAALDLAPLGFEVLFEAEWLGLPAGRVPSGTEPPDVRWEVVKSGAGLADWEGAWRGSSGNAAAEADPDRIFGPALLDDPDIAFVAGHRAHRIVASVVGNRSDDGSGPVVGVSNLVLPGEGAGGAAGVRSGAVAAVGSVFPGLPLVGYERGPDLDAMLGLGFAALGPLRVWVVR